MTPSPVVDAQVHCFEWDHPTRPWTGVGSPLLEATGAQTVARMDAAGVDAAVLVSPWLNYLADPSYAFEVASAYPGRFAVVAPIDLGWASNPDAVDDILSRPHASGLRHVLWSPAARAAILEGTLDGVLQRMQLKRVPLCLAFSGPVTEAEYIASRFPDLPVVIDHLGLPATPTPPPPPAPFTGLDPILDLGRHANVLVKVTGLPALSHDPYPYLDLRDPLRRVIDRFGPSRVLWGTDWTRVHAFHSYQDGVDWIGDAGLTASEAALVRGQNTLDVFFRGR